MTTLDEATRALAESLGADLYGVADLTGAQESIRTWGGAMVLGYPRAIAVGIRLMDAIVDTLPRQERLAALGYRRHAYDVVNNRLDDLISRLAGALQRQGCRAMPIAASGASDGERLYGAFSHKMGARLAGLGWIGRSCLLVTPQYGPRVRWATILTDAPLTPTGPALDDGCGACHECVDVCPPHAFTGRPFREDEPRDVRYDAFACSRHLASREKELGAGICGLCLWVCPFGRP